MSDSSETGSRTSITCHTFMSCTAGQDSKEGIVCGGGMGCCSHAHMIRERRERYAAWNAAGVPLHLSLPLLLNLLLPSSLWGSLPCPCVVYGQVVEKRLRERLRSLRSRARNPSNQVCMLSSFTLSPPPSPFPCEQVEKRLRG